MLRVGDIDRAHVVGAEPADGHGAASGQTHLERAIVGAKEMLIRQAGLHHDADILFAVQRRQRNAVRAGAQPGLRNGERERLLREPRQRGGTEAVAVDGHVDRVGHIGRPEDHQIQRGVAAIRRIDVAADRHRLRPRITGDERAEENIVAGRDGVEDAPLDPLEREGDAAGDRIAAVDVRDRDAAAAVALR